MPNVIQQFRPLGNLLTASSTTHHSNRSTALGCFSVLDDNLIVRVLDSLVSESESRKSVETLLALSEVSSFFLAFSGYDDLWRRLAFSLFTPSQIAGAPFQHTWRHTALKLLFPSRSCKKLRRTTANVPVVLPTIHSDVLFHQQRCRTASIDPSWLVHQDIQKVSAEGLSLNEFRRRFENPRRPVIMTGVVPQWRAFREWDAEKLTELCGSQSFNAGGFQFSLGDYLRYCTAIEGSDDQPLYVFDSKFADKVPALAKQYSRPPCFPEDLFAVLGDQRPDYRWLIIGPARSGSSFHKDPNETSAWNAAIRGRKKWVMFPPDVPPPGVVPSADGGDVVAPLSVMEWFLNFYDRDVVVESKAMECVLEEGELIFIPRGWWHCVLNIDLSIALTQNFVSSVNLGAVVTWFHTKPEHVSGCRSRENAEFISSNFVRLVVERFPGLCSVFDSCEQKRKRMNADNPTAAIATPTKRRGLWQSLQTLESKAVEVDFNTIELGRSRPEQFSFGF